MPGPVPLEVRLWSRVVVDEQRPTGCWIWTGATNGVGYGRIWADGRMQYTHRLAFERLIGPIPEGMVLDHLCRTPLCCNPAHLEPVDQAENKRRGLRGTLTTHCPAGHEYTAENTRFERRPNGNESRRCKACRRARSSSRAAS